MELINRLSRIPYQLRSNENYEASVADIICIRGWCPHQSTRAKANWTLSLRPYGLVETLAMDSRLEYLNIITQQYPMKKNLIIVLTIISTQVFAQQKNLQNLVQFVKPIIGTQRMGHTYPGATAPFGMVQLSPDTDTLSYELDGKYNPDIYKYCAGYQYDDKTIVGFSHTHFSGTGHSDLGDFLIMPTTGTLQLNPGTADRPLSGFRSAFSHQNETAEAGYYKVKLDDHNILAELTATNRVGFHQYTFPKSDEAHIILDLMSGIYNYPDKNVWTYVRIENDTLITGYRRTNGWARTRTEYFAMTFSKPFYQYGNF